jgi:lipopolysaccharide heptosyltransferase II
MGWGKRVIVLSNVIARHMIEDFRVPCGRIRLIPRSVDLAKFKYSDPAAKRKEEFNVGIIGRVTPIKGHLYFIKAAAKAARAIPRLKIFIVGDAPGSKEAYKEQLQVLVRRLGLWNSTEFLGTQRDIPEILKHLDLLVLATTTHEAFGRVIVEAQASGVPVVATRVGGVIDIIEDGKTGLLVSPADANSMAEAIIRIFKEPEFARGLAENAYKKVEEKYSVELMVKNTISVYQDALSNFKFLILKFSSLGDIILSTAAIRAIREKFGDNHKITFLVGEESKDVLLRCPYIDELLVCDFKSKDKGLGGLWKLGRVLRKEGFDAVIDLQNNRKSHILSFLSLSPHRYGYDKKLGLFLNHKIKDERPGLDPVTHQFRILKMLGIELKDKHLELWPSEEDRQYAEELLKSEWLSASQKLIGLNLSASSRWPTKHWPLSCVDKLCEELGRKDMRLVITGTQKDIEAANCLAAMVKFKPINTCGKTSINQLAGIIKKCAAYISPDSASLHIAAAMDVPFVALFGPTDPARHLQPADDYVLIRKSLPCSPCYKSKCKDVKCMEMISAQEVLEAVIKLIK